MNSHFFYLNNEKLVVRERKKELERKPKYYLFNLTKKRYVSSLYHLADNKYKYDYQGKEYILIMEEEISVKEVKRELGFIIDQIEIKEIPIEKIPIKKIAI